MLIKLTAWGLVLACYLSASLLHAEDYTGPIIQTPQNMNVEKVGAFFDEFSDADKFIWAPLARDTTRLVVNIPRNGFERALEFKDGNALFHLSNVNDLGLSLHKADRVLIRLNLAVDGYLMEARHDLREGFAAGLSVEYLDQYKLSGSLNKAIAYNNTTLSTTVAYNTEAKGYIGGEVVQLSIDDGSELFSWMNFSTEENSRSLGFGKTWFDIQYDLDNTFIAHWDNRGWTGGLLLNKVKGETKFRLGLVDIDQNFTPTIYADFLIPLQKARKFSSEIFIKSRGLRSQYFPQRSLRSFRRNELSSQWRDAMDFSLQN